MTPEKAFKSIKKEHIRIFEMAFVMGLIIHGFRLTNHLLTWDSVFNFHDPQIKLALGRCFLSFGCAISSYYDVQWVCGLLSIAYLSVICIFIILILDINGKVQQFLTCAVIVGFPSVAGTFAYMYTADGYMLAGLLAVLSVWFSLNSKGKKGYIISIALMGLSAGMYQAYTAYGLMLILTWFLTGLLFTKEKTRDLLKKLLYMAVSALLGIIAYFICNKFILFLTGTSPTDYNGISDMGFSGARGLVFAAKNCIIDTIYFFIGPLHKISLFQITNIIMLLMILCLIVYRLSILPMDWQRKVLCVICLLAIPFVSFMIYFISPGVRYYMLMMAPLQMIYLLPIVFRDFYFSEDVETAQAPGRAWNQDKGGFGANEGSVKAVPRERREDILSNKGRSEIIKWLPSWGLFILMLIIVINFCLLDNISYLYMVSDNEKTLQFANRLASRMEALPDFSEAKYLCVAGKLPDYDKIEVMLPPAMAGIKDGILISDTAHFTAVLDTYCDIALEPVEKEEGESLSQTSDIKEMPIWPDSGSVRQQGDIIIVKLGH